MVSVNGRYAFNDKGYLDNDDGTYTHEILLVKSDPAVDYDLCVDSENPSGLLKVKRGYKYSSPKVGYLKKKSMFRIIKTSTSPACYLHCLASGHLFGIADGDEVNGAQLLKSFCGDNYANAHIAVVSDVEFATYQHVGDIKTVLLTK